MTINIKNSEADKLVQELSALTGEDVTEIVIKSLVERLEREKRKQRQESNHVSLKNKLLTIARSYQELPTIDKRSAEEILGYEDGY